MKLYKVVEHNTKKLISFADNKTEAKKIRDDHNNMVKDLKKKKKGNQWAYITRGPDHWKGLVQDA